MEKLNKRQLHRPLQPEVVVVGLPVHPSPTLGPKGEGKIQAPRRQNLGVPRVAPYTHPSAVSRAGKALIIIGSVPLLSAQQDQSCLAQGTGSLQVG